MPSLGPAEILVILIVALLVFGPNKMPEIARQVGRGMRELRRVQEHLSSEFHDVVSEFQGNDAAQPAPAGDAAPTLPPRADATSGDAPPTSATPAASNGTTADTTTPATTGGSETGDRGARVWPPSPGDNT